jgi:hypothetical protein
MADEREERRKRENIGKQADSPGTGDTAETKQSPLTEEVLKKQERSEERRLEDVERKADATKSGEAHSSEDKIHDQVKGEQDAA